LVYKDINMNQAAYDAISSAWGMTIKLRALCPSTNNSAIGMASYSSPGWYREHGAIYFVKPEKPLTMEDIKQLNQIGDSVNQSFIISMATILEAYGIVPYKTNPDRTKLGGDHVQLIKWLRNRFAHGEREYNPKKKTHVETRQLLESLFPGVCAISPGFVISIDMILEPLKEGALSYIKLDLPTPPTA
jgi:hypothetical protein